MGRLDWKQGRFDVRVETDSIEEGIRGFVAGTVHESIDYWRFSFQTSSVNDIYNENFGAGRDYHPVVNVPAYHVRHIRGGLDNKEAGFYYNDRLLVTTSYQLFYRSGLTEADVRRRYYLKDVLYYDNSLFQIDTIDIEGQISRYGGRTIVSIEASQIKPDEMSYDQILAHYANQGSPAPWEK